MPFAYVMPLSVLPFCVMPFRHRDAFLRDVYLIMALSVFLPFTVALFLQAYSRYMSRYMSCLTYPFSLILGYLILS